MAGIEEGGQIQCGIPNKTSPFQNLYPIHLYLYIQGKMFNSVVIITYDFFSGYCSYLKLLYTNYDF